MILHKSQTRVARFWINAGKCFLCNFYEINSSQDFFCIANILVLMVRIFPGHVTETGKIHSRCRILILQDAIESAQLTGA